MDSDSWRNHLASASRRYQLAFLSRSDTFLGFEEIDGEDDFREEFACPFCSDYFDIVSLCCHIDEEHPTEARNGRKRKSRRGGSQSTLSEILKSEFPERNLESLFGDSSCVVSSSTANAAADPLLSSFISPMPDGFFTSECRLLAPETDLSRKTSNETSLERNVGKQSLSAEDHKEKLKRSEFVQGLLSSVILDDGL
ncbi:PREDICTED: protein DEHYDRATION-INDUCED 19 homolog 6-like isoform X2 [Tarenaya hassleriana]|uniref:protein DEHYDRATION-INDUCED 19 homolog 6-like isoform X2 n=1 Tax=Tarenaya hassleriana TaxID=28532 RepID=UPI00053C4480|nr:PREDICTED: protein DEHYDRATION-INDUCED 19 homolog 6-like isoform X2 [Tarenaya hassleriana]